MPRCPNLPTRRRSTSGSASKARISRTPTGIEKQREEFPSPSPPPPPPCHGITKKISPPFQLRVLPAENAGRDGKAACHLEAVDPAQTQVLLRHLRRRRLDARPHARGGAGNSERRGRCRAAS